MILITGATGFVGQRLTAHLVALGRPVCCLVRPARKERRFPPGLTVRIAAGDVDDPPALRAAMQDVEAVVHLAALQAEDSQRTFEAVNYQGTLNVIEAAHDANVKRLIYLGRLGANAGIAYPLWRSMGQAEEAVHNCELNYTILRSSTLYGEGDEWLSNIAMVLKSVPLIFPVVGDGQARLQPLWVEDLVKCIEQCLDDPTSIKKTLTVGGPEYLTLDHLVDTLAQVLKVQRRKVHLREPLALWLAGAMKRLMLRPLLTQTIIEGLSVNTTTDLSAVQRQFGLKPSRLAEAAVYLCGRPLRREFMRRLIVGV